jgi:hypothetical protein
MAGLNRGGNAKSGSCAAYGQIYSLYSQLSTPAFSTAFKLCLRWAVSLYLEHLRNCLTPDNAYEKNTIPKGVYGTVRRVLIAIMYRQQRLADNRKGKKEPLCRFTCGVRF